ncbi:unnamed protein product [Paramecium pentaurelia]|uniref:Uncharacterized protein n=1 Tax=Paramecium pentaurelia TaxID=43138 RepID=A0A8S1WZ30_9CILI|nr:unnamed protein product [Paramecium pentaurelia]
MNELENEFLTQCNIESSAFSHSYIEQIYNEVHFNNIAKRDQIARLKKEEIQYQIKQEKQQLHVEEIEKALEQKQYLEIDFDRILYSILLRQKYINDLEDQLRLINSFYQDLPIEHRESQQTKKLSYLSYSKYKLSYDEYIKQLENKKVEVLDNLEKIKNETQQTQQNYYSLLQKIKQAQQTLVEQEKTIQQLNDQNETNIFKLHEQRKVVIDLQVLQKLERMYLTFEEGINEEFITEDINKVDCNKEISDFMHTHPFGVSFLVENLIQQYRKYQVQIDSESSIGLGLMEEKQELQQELKELKELCERFYIYDENQDEDQQFQDIQKLMGFLTMKQSQNNFKQNLLHKAETFIIKVFGNLYNAIKRFNDIFQAIHQKRMAIDLKSSQIDSKIKNFCANTYIGHYSLSLYQYMNNPLTSTQPDLYHQIQNSIILKLYVNEDALNQYLQAGSTFIKLYLKASDYYSNQIHLMIELIHSITQIPKRPKFTYNDSPLLQQNYKSKLSIELSQKKISLRTDTESRAQVQVNFKTKTTKRNSFTSTIGSSRRIQQDINEENYLESERQKIINPKNNISNTTKIPSEQQKYCDLLSERGHGFEKKVIIQNFKSLIKLRQIKRKFKTNPITPKSIIGSSLIFKSTYK